MLETSIDMEKFLGQEEKKKLGEMAVANLELMRSMWLLKSRRRWYSELEGDLLESAWQQNIGGLIRSKDALEQSQKKWGEKVTNHEQDT